MHLRFALGAVAIVAAATTVFAQSAGPFDGAIAARKAHMGLNGFNLGVLGAMAQDKAPYDAAAATAAAANLVALSNMNISGYFPAGSDAGANANTRALPELWANMDDVMAKMGAVREATAAMQVAAGTDLDALKAAMGGLGAACGACHKAYRQPQ